MTSRPLRIRVDHARCVGNAMCVACAPSTFEHNDDRQSVVVDAAGDSVETVVDAAMNCPTNAIYVTDAETGEVLFGPTP